MRYLVMIYSDDALLKALPEGEADAMMRHCFASADKMSAEGHLLGSEQLEAPATAKTVRIRQGQTSIVDGPFAETKEYLGGFNIIEAADMDEALRIAAGFPWAGTGSIEIRPIRDMDSVRRRVGA